VYSKKTNKKKPETKVRVNLTAGQKEGKGEENAQRERE
jgi:hypothetical protein